MEVDKAAVVSPATVGTTDPSPPSPVQRKPSRRSSAACARRLSRASGAGGISLEDMLATVPNSDEASVKERLAKVVQLVLASTVRGVVARLEEEEEGDAARSVGAAIRQVGINSEVVERVAHRLEGGVEVETGGVVGEQVRRVREYTDKLQKEGERWKELLVERKEMVRNVERNARAAAKGEITVSEEQRFSLSAQEKTMIKKLPNCKAALEQLAGHGDKVELSARAVATQTVRLKRSLEEVEERLGLAARKLIKRADTVGGRVEELETGPGMWFGGNTEMDRVKGIQEVI